MIRILLFHAQDASLECFCENYTGNEEIETIIFCFKLKVKWQLLSYEMVSSPRSVIYKGFFRYSEKYTMSKSLSSIILICIVFVFFINKLTKIIKHLIRKFIGNTIVL